MLRTKVPQLTVLFWVTKLLTTAMGETASDYLVKHFDPVLAVCAAFVVFAVVLAGQFAARRYIPWLYWAAVLMVAVFGTMVADVLHVELGVPYLVSTLVLAVALAVIFTVWYRTQRTLSVHSIDTRAREAFYWCAVLATFALGTAVGDLTAVTFGMGYLLSGVVFAVLFALPGIAYRWWGLGSVAAFWIAYVLTRPLGASFADWLAVSHARGGLDLGTGPVSLVLFAGIAVCVAAMTVADVRERRARAVPLVVADPAVAGGGDASAA
ncbi:COG4705 family protein [Leifsonia sp. AG29]|uniref:COG4705 family protein n=1 Tax=Leifsonia sp. AG29 TaxID=2598860 RepID=UPI00131C3B61|nr:hypothetical protein [Leifsonia sp. AG29]